MFSKFNRLRIIGLTSSSKRRVQNSGSKYHPNVSTFGDMKLVGLDKTDTTDVQNLVTKHYIPNSPFLKAANFDPKKVRPAFHQAIAEDIQSNTSLGFRLDCSGKLIACIMCSPHTNQTSPKHKENRILPEYSRFWSWCFQDIHAQLNTEQFHYSGMLTVHRSYARRGLGRELVNASEQVARQASCNNVVAICVNAHAFENLRSLGYDVLRQIRLIDYVDNVTGLKPFTIENPPHTHAMICHKLV